MGLPCKAFLSSIPGLGGHKNLCGRRDLLIMSVAAGLPKYTRSILLKTPYKAKNNATAFLTRTLHVET